MEMDNQEDSQLSPPTTPPVPEPSMEGHVKSFGSEMLTRAPEGAAVGLVLGLVVGLITYFIFSVGDVSVPGIDLLRKNNPVQFLIFVVLTAGIVGTFWGTVIGIGTPKIKPHPDQGWVRAWKMFTVRVHNKEKHVYVPEFKDRKLDNPAAKP